MKQLLLILLAVILVPTKNFAQDYTPEKNKPIKVQRINSPIKLDGLSNEVAWDGIKSLPMVMWMPSFSNEPSERTEILLGYDDDYLYAAGRFYDIKPSKIQASSLKRDVWEWTTDTFLT